MKVAAIQHACKDTTQKTMEHTASLIRQAAKLGAELVVLQELHCDVYFCQTENVETCGKAEPIPGPQTDFFAALAKEHALVLVGSFFERRASGLYHNTAVVFEKNGDIAGTYRKMHIPDDPGFYEKFYFTPGDKGFTPIQTSVGKLGVLVCWDQWYPEAARLMTLAGADLLLYPTAIGWDTNDSSEEQARQREAWITVQRGHAIANGIPLISVNRVGHETDPSGKSTGIQFWGSSFIVGPQGEFLSEANELDEHILSYDINPKQTEAVRRIWPFLRDRRIDAYGDITSRWLD